MTFTRKRTFNDRLSYDERSFNEIIRQLRAAGFIEIEIKIPPKYIEQFQKEAFSPEEFSQLKYNFVAQVLTALNGTEIIKILFINHGKSILTLNDKVFPSSHSTAPSFYLETPDPVRLIGLEDFVRTLLEKNSARALAVAKFQDMLFFASNLFVASVVAVLVGAMQINDFSVFNKNSAWIVSLSFVALVYFFYYIVHPGGLYTAPFEHPLVSFSRRISAGDFKNNLIVVVFVWIIKVIIGGIIIGVVVNILSDVLKEPILNSLRGWLR